MTISRLCTDDVDKLLAPLADDYARQFVQMDEMGIEDKVDRRALARSRRRYLHQRLDMALNLADWLAESDMFEVQE